MGDTTESGYAGALTTTFVPEDYCTKYISFIADLTAECTKNSANPVCRYYHLGPETDTNCMPSGWEPEPTLYYSPGICPAGYTIPTRCSSITEVDGTSETRATCCPSKYGCQFSTNLPWFLTEHCQQVIPASVTFIYTTSTIGGDVESFSTWGWRQTIHAFGVEIRWKSEDFASTTTATETSSTDASTTLTQSSSLPTADSEESDEGGGLSDSAKIGIGVGVGIGALIIILAAMFLFMRRRRRLENAPPPELPTSPMSATKVPATGELPDTYRFSTAPTELATDHGHVQYGYNQPVYSQPGSPDPTYQR